MRGEVGVTEIAQDAEAVGPGRDGEHIELAGEVQIDQHAADRGDVFEAGDLEMSVAVPLVVSLEHLGTRFAQDETLSTWSLFRSATRHWRTRLPGRLANWFPNG